MVSVNEELHGTLWLMWQKRKQEKVATKSATKIETINQRNSTQLFITAIHKTKRKITYKNINLKQLFFSD